jgi:subtilase family serine protease
MSADPNVTSVGGTETFAQFDQNGNDIGYSPEDAWNSDSDATGGGVSGVFTKPQYQTGPGVPADANRDVPDIALIASPSLPGVFWGDAVMGPASVVCCIGGTSLSSPMMAGMVEVLDQQVGRLGRMNDIIYTLANQQYGQQAADNGFHDVTNGNNSLNGVTGYNAGPGYDETTGWGSIDFDVFASAVKSNLPPVMTTMTPRPGTINFGNVDASGVSKPHKVTVINKGTVNAIVGTLIPPTGFMIVPGSDLCTGQTIVAKKSCSVFIEFAPSAPGPASGALMIPYNGATNASVSLTGNGTQVVLRKPATVAFPPQVAGTPSKAKLVSIMNPSRTATVVLSAAQLSDPFTPAPGTDTCSNATLAPHGRCSISLVFTPPNGTASKTSMPGSLTFDYTYGSNPSSATVTLKGTVR